MESDGLSEDGHVNKQEAYKDQCVIEALILLVGVAFGLMPLFDSVSRNNCLLVPVKQRQYSICVTLEPCCLVKKYLRKSILTH